jgi:hypothetical protein
MSDNPENYFFSKYIAHRRKVVYISVPLLQMICTEGWRADVKCVVGLPETARYVYTFTVQTMECIGMVFEDDSFPLTSTPGEILPQYARYHHD